MKPHWLLRYGFAVLVVASTLGLIHTPGYGHLGHIFYLAVLICAWYGGFGPGVLAAVVFAVAAGITVVRTGQALWPKPMTALLLFLAGAMAIAVLVEALHLARRRAEASQKWLSGVLHSIGDAVIATDDQGRVNFMNPVAESLSGWIQSDAIGRPLPEVFQIINEQTRELAVNPVERVLVDGNSVGLANHTLLIARDGTECPIDDSAAPIRTDRGPIEGVVLVFRDVTERRTAEAAVAEESRRKDEFLAMLAHELRNPLAAIANTVQILLQPGSAALGDWSVAVIDRQVKQLTRLVDDLLDVARITRGKIQLQPQRIDLATIIKAATESIQPLIDERRHELHVAIEPEPIVLQADPTRLEQVLVNLLANAAKYTERPGRIGLTARRVERQVVIQVQDTGIGIASHLLGRVFDLFVQGDRSLVRSEGGLGIGLTMVRRLVEMHGGTVNATSEGPGRGSTFTLVLPAAIDEPPAGVASPPLAPAPARDRILIVDDNVDLTRSMARLLRLLGHEVATAFDGPAGIETARAFRPSFILLDIGLPGMDGYQVVGHLRRDPATKDSTIIAITGYGQEEDRLRALSAGFNHHLAKPVDHNTLISLLHGTPHQGP